MEETESLLGRGGGGESWVLVLEEVKRVGSLAGPLVAVVLSQYFIQILSVMMVGHLGELALSSTAVALSLSGATGFSFLFGLSNLGKLLLSPVLGMASALETLCGQAYGAGQYHKLGTQTYTAIVSLFLVCLPLALIWIYMGQFLAFMGQDPAISAEAGRFSIWLVPALFGYAALQAVVRYLQCQSLILPLLLTSCATLGFHVPLCWFLVFKSGLGSTGGALAIGISYWLNVILLGLYINYSSACKRTRVPVSMEVLGGIREFFSFAVPSAVMVCLEWWSFELLILLSGLLPNPELEASVLSVCLSTVSTLYAIPYGLGSAGSTRVSNELGAGNAGEARLAVYAVVCLAATEAIVVSSALFAGRHVFGYIFSSEEEVVNYVRNMAPFLCVSVILDSLQGVLSGIVRGCGRQRIGVFINLGAFYVCGIPAAVILAFLVHVRGKGLWVGIQTGSFLQTSLLLILIGCTNWEDQATKARQRIFEGPTSSETLL